MNWHLRLLQCIIICFASLASIAIAQEAFDGKVANSVLDKLTIKLSIEQPSTKSLQEAANTLLEHQDKANICIQDAEEELADIQLKLPTITEGIELTKDQRYLKQKQSSIEARLAECKLFVLRSEEAISAFTKKAKELSTLAILKHGPNLWTQIQDTKKIFTDLKFDLKSVIKNLNFNVLGPFHYWALLALILLSMILSRWGYILLGRIRQNLEDKPQVPLLWKSFISILKHHIFTLPLLLVVSIFFALILLAKDIPAPTYFSICFILLGYTLFIGVMEFLFYPPKEEATYFIVDRFYAKPFFRSLQIFSMIIAFGLAWLIFLQDQNAPLPVIYLSRSILFTLLTVTLMFLLIFFNRLPKFMARHKNARAFISVLSAIIFIGIIISEWTGYQALSRYLLEGIVLTFFATILTWLIHKIIQSFLNSFDEHQYEWQTAFHEMLGVKKTDSLPEMVGLKSGMFILVWGIYLIALSNIWNVTHTWANQVTVILTETITIPNTEISFIPSRLIIGFIVFSIGILLVRFLKARILSKVTTSKHKAEREAYAGIFGYLGFAIAFLFALVLAGVNLRGLAIIAGALSVGIGFGLQNIVNNFVSGIILLLERPIKPGDRIAIGDEEGFVKNVRIRSTVINTIKNMDIIIPNADLISSQVVNQTFNNYRARIELKVGVAYGSDIRLVEKSLFEAAFNHPEVIKEGNEKPKVLFIEFGDSSLNFELWVIIRNVNLKYIVLSELNFMIDDIFRQRHIVIAFPQRDIHIKESPSTSRLPQKGEPDVDE